MASQQSHLEPLGISSCAPAALCRQMGNLTVNVGLIPRDGILFVIRTMTKPPSGAQSGDKHDSVRNTVFRHSPE